MSTNPMMPDVAELVEEGRVHSRVFTDQTIFDLEMERIFHRDWVYIGHASEVPRHGDYQVRKIGRQSVVMIRDKDGTVKVFMNRCRHRGSQICDGRSGNAKVLRCWFHGWVYSTGGDLIEVPIPAAYDDKFNQQQMGLTPPPKVGVYRDFVFASLNPESLHLEAYLGHAREMIDLMVFASPSGTIRLQAGANRTTYKGNWKFVGMDGAITRRTSMRRSSRPGIATRTADLRRPTGAIPSTMRTVPERAIWATVMECLISRNIGWSTSPT